MLDYVLLPGTLLDKLFNLLTSANAIVLLAGLSFGVLLGVWAEDRYRLSVTTGNKGRRLIQKRLAYERAGLIALTLFGLVAAILADPLGRIVSRIETIPTPYGELKLRTNVVAVQTSQKAVSQFSDRSAYLRNIDNIEQQMISMRDFSEDIAVHIGVLPNSIESLAVSQGMLDDFRTYVAPFFGCEAALYYPTRTILPPDWDAIILDLRKIARYELSDADLNRIIERLVFRFLILYSDVADMVRISGGSERWEKYCDVFLEAIRSGPEFDIEDIVQGCADISGRIICRGHRSRAAMRLLRGRVKSRISPLRASERPYIVYAVQQLLAFEGKLLEAAAEVDRWLLDEPGRWATEIDARQKQLSDTLVSVQMMWMRDSLMATLREFIPQAQEGQRQPLYEQYVKLAFKQLDLIDRIIGPYDWDKFYLQRPCLKEVQGSGYEGFIAQLRYRRTIHLGNILYALTQLDDFEETYARDVLDTADMLRVHLSSCARNRQANSGQMAVMETVGSAYLRLLTMFVERSRLAFGDPAALLNSAEEAYRLCRQEERGADSVSGGAGLPLIYQLNLRAQGALLARCKWGQQKIRELRSQLL